MAYKKYIKRNGKLYGPYIYHSRRVNGKVVSEYQGTVRKTDYKKFIFIFFGIIFVLGLGYGIVSNKTKFTGNVVVDLDTNYQGVQTLQKLEGIMNISLSQEEFIPALSKLSFETSDGNYTEYELQDLLNEEPIEGNFYIQGKNISGIGLGYGILGEKKILYINLSELDLVLGGDVKATIFYEDEEIISFGTLKQEENRTIEIIEDTSPNDTENLIDESTNRSQVSNEFEIIKDILPLSNAEKQILINEFGTDIIETKVKLFNERVIVRYELGERWIENSYDSSLDKEELEEQMEVDRIRWLRDMINQILKEEIQEQEFWSSEENHSIS